MEKAKNDNLPFCFLIGGYCIIWFWQMWNCWCT